MPPECGLSDAFRGRFWAVRGRGTASHLTAKKRGQYLLLTLESWLQLFVSDSLQFTCLCDTTTKRHDDQTTCLCDTTTKRPTRRPTTTNLASSRPPCLAVNMRPMAAVSTAPNRKHATASGKSVLRSDHWIAGRPTAGSPWGTSPSDFTPRASRPSHVDARVPPSTTKSATGLFLRRILPRTSTAREMPPMVREAGLVSCRCLKKWALFSQESPCSPWKPNSFGIAAQ